MPAGLRVPDPSVDAATELEAHLGELGALPRSGFTGDDHHLVVTDRVQELVASIGDRQVGRI